MHNLVAPVLYERFMFFPDKYDLNPIRCNLIKRLHIVMKPTPVLIGRTNLENHHDQTPRLFHPPSSPIPWSIFTNLQSLTLAPQDNLTLAPYPDPGQDDGMPPFKLTDSIDPHRKILYGMLPQGNTSVTHITLSDIPYVQLLETEESEPGWNIPIPSVTHFQLQALYAKGIPAMLSSRSWLGGINLVAGVRGI